MAVAILKPYLDNNTLMMRGDVGAGADGEVSLFYPYRAGNNIYWRGKNADGDILIAWPFRDGNNLYARTYRSGDGGTGEMPGVGDCCQPLEGDPCPEDCQLAECYTLEVGGWVDKAIHACLGSINVLLPYTCCNGSFGVRWRGDLLYYFGSYDGGPCLWDNLSNDPDHICAGGYSNAYLACINGTWFALVHYDAFGAQCNGINWFFWASFIGPTACTPEGEYTLQQYEDYFGCSTPGTAQAPTLTVTANEGCDNFNHIGTPADGPEDPDDGIPIEVPCRCSEEFETACGLQTQILGVIGDVQFSDATLSVNWIPPGQTDFNNNTDFDCDELNWLTVADSGTVIQAVGDAAFDDLVRVHNACSFDNLCSLESESFQRLIGTIACTTNASGDVVVCCDFGGGDVELFGEDKHCSGGLMAVYAYPYFKIEMVTPFVVGGNTYFWRATGYVEFRIFGIDDPVSTDSFALNAAPFTNFQMRFTSDYIYPGTEGDETPTHTEWKYGYDCPQSGSINFAKRSDGISGAIGAYDSETELTGSGGSAGWNFAPPIGWLVDDVCGKILLEAVLP